MNNKKGISLVALLVTIIVIIILASIIILSLSDSGVIDKSSEAVGQTNLATVKELAERGWAKAYASGAKTDDDFKNGVDKILADNNIDTSIYDIIVTKDKVLVKLKKEVFVWVQQGLTVTNGKDTLKIGDKVAYDETAKDTIAGLTPTEWQVLGANDKGELLIVSTENISRCTFGFSEWDFLNAKTKLDAACAQYGMGRGAISVRSIDVDDIDKITGFDKTRYEKNTLSEYGIDVAYSWVGERMLAYSATNNVSGKTEMDEFGYYDGTKFVDVSYEGATEAKPKEIITLTNNYYEYDARELTTINEKDKSYTMLFGEYESEERIYWLAKDYTHTRECYADFGVFVVYERYGNGIWIGNYRYRTDRS